MARRWLFVLVSAVLGLAVAALYLSLQPATYTATAHNLVTSDGGRDGGTVEAVPFAQALGRVAASPAVVAEPLRGAGLAVPTEDLRERVRISVSPDAPLIEIVANADDAPTAARLANTVSTALASYADARRQETGVRAQQFTVATPPAEPSGPRGALTLALGLLLGLLVGSAFGLLGSGVPRRA